MANEHSSNKGEEDVVELKRALATGSASTQSNSASASAYGIHSLVCRTILIEIGKKNYHGIQLRPLFVIAWPLFS